MATKKGKNVAKSATIKKNKIDTSFKNAEENKKRKPNFFLCSKCGTTIYSLDDFVSSQSELYAGLEYRIPVCRKCMDVIFNHYVNQYEKISDNPDAMALRRVCQHYDIYYNDSLLESALMKVDTKNSLMMAYIKMINLRQYKGKTYDTTLDFERSNVIESVEDIEEDSVVNQKTIDFFGAGFPLEDYEFLQKEYDDWITRHECKTKAQEEIFKRLVFKQLEILKATRAGSDTKDLDSSFQKLLETAKLQPRQNSAEAISDAQTFGTLIDKWETTRPLPDIDEELKDVDKIALYTDVFFKGHLAKMMGLKNGLSNLYTKFMKKYTVEKPEYDDDSDSEVLFDAIFGNSSSMDEE